MASRLEMGLTLYDIRLKKCVLPHGTPVTVAITEQYWVITVIQGEHSGTKFKMRSRQADEAIEILL